MAIVNGLYSQSIFSLTPYLRYQDKNSFTGINTSDVIIDSNLENREDILPDINSQVKRLKSISFFNNFLNLI